MATGKQRKPSVLFINRVYPPGKGATGRMLSELAQAMVKDGWAVSILTTGSKTEDRREDSVFVRRIRAGTRQSILNYGWIWLRLFHAVGKFNKIDLIVTMTDPPLISIIGRALAKKKKITHIHWCQDIYPDLLPVLDKKLPSFIFRFLQSQYYSSLKNCARVIAIGRCMAAHINRVGQDPRRIVVISNWANKELFEENKSVSLEFQKIKQTRQERPLRVSTDAKFRVLYAGNIGRAHPLSTILEAAEILQLSHPEIEFIFVGEGAGHERLAIERANKGLENIRLLPTQPAVQLKQIMQSGDLHLISMNQTAAGLLVPSKLYSALAAGRPCLFVGPAESEAARVLQDYKAGEIIAQGQPRMLADAIVAYRSNEDKWFEAHQNALKASADFKPEKMMSRWIACARSAIRSPVS